MKESDLKILVEKLKEKKEGLFRAAQIVSSILNNNQETTSYYKIYTLAVLNRSMSIIEGYLTLLETKNFISISPLIRIHLDSLIRFNALLISDSANETAKLISKGKKIFEIKDREGKPMNDGYLVSRLNIDYDWVKNVYDRTCGYVHFSGQHIFDMVSHIEHNEDEEFLKVFHLIGNKDDHVKIDSWIEATVAMIEISKLISKLTFSLFKEELDSAIKKQT